VKEQEKKEEDLRFRDAIRAKIGGKGADDPTGPFDARAKDEFLVV
jgi:hypothetical protein